MRTRYAMQSRKLSRKYSDWSWVALLVIARRQATNRSSKTHLPSLDALTMWRRLGLDCRHEFGRKMCGQTLNDVQELHDFLLAQCVDLVVQQFDF